MINKKAILSPKMLLSFDLKFVNMCEEEDSTGKFDTDKGKANERTFPI